MTSLSDSPVLIEVEDNIAWVTLNRPDVLNALNAELFSHLESILMKIENDSNIRVVVVTGNGRAFSTGGDLNEFLLPNFALNKQEVLKVVEHGRKVLGRIRALSKPVIAAVNGLALAGGLELALSCDVVLAAGSARMGDGHLNYGLIPGGGGASGLVRTAGPLVAKYLAFTGDAIPVAELQRHGLVNEVIPDGGLTCRASEVARRIGNKSAPGVARMKSLINGALDLSFESALDAEYAALKAQMSDVDALDGLKEFYSRRNHGGDVSRRWQ